MTDTDWLHPPMTEVRPLVERALAEDQAPLGDLTSSLLEPRTIEYRFASRGTGRLAGTRCAGERFISERSARTAATRDLSLPTHSMAAASTRSSCAFG